MEWDEHNYVLEEKDVIAKLGLKGNNIVFIKMLDNMKVKVVTK